MSAPTWKTFTQRAVERYCGDRGVRTFTLPDLARACREDFERYAPRNRHIREKIRQTLQYLRDDGVLTFVDGRGTYTLRSISVLPGEVEEDKIDFLRTLPPRKREYLIEVFARNRGWVALARKAYGSYCLYPDCPNTFMTPRGIPYVEVHHIRPLCDGGEEALWNLSVICAHHHRMAHFSDRQTRLMIGRVLKSIVEERSASLHLSARTPR